jgi:hypothetical protein
MPLVRQSIAMVYGSILDELVKQKTSPKNDELVKPKRDTVQSQNFIPKLEGTQQRKQRRVVQSR